RARRRVHDLLHTCGPRCDEDVGRADDVDRLEQMPVAGQRHLRDVVEHDVDAVTGTFDRRAVADVARDVLDVGAEVTGRIEVEDPDGGADGERLAGELRAEVPAATGD